MQSSRSRFRSHAIAASAAISLLAVTAPSSRAQCDPLWSSQFGGNSNRLNGAVNALATFDDDGDGPHPAAIYAAGDFTFAGAATLNHIGRRDGIWWSSLGTGLNGPAHALLTVDTNALGLVRGLYVGGDFSAAGNAPAAFIARWDGTTWHALGAGLGETVLSLSLFDEDGDGPGSPALFAGTTRGVSRWDGSAWTEFAALNNRGDAGRVNALAVFDEDGNGSIPSRLFAGGDFVRLGGVQAGHIARWNGEDWTPVGGGTDGSHVASLTVHSQPLLGQYLVVSGYFHNAGGVSAWKIARWTGAAWFSFSSDSSYFFSEVELVRSVDPDGNGPLRPELYAFNGGYHGLFRWTGTQFVRAVPGQFTIVADVLAFDQSGDGTADLILGGDFLALGSPAQPDAYFAVWNGADWTPQTVETGAIRVPVNSIIAADLDGPGSQPTTLFKSGGWTQFPSATLSSWDGTRWRDISFSRFNTSVTAMTIHDPDGPGPAHSLLIIGGMEGGSTNRPGVAAWDGLSWTPLTMTFSERINALASFESNGTTQLFAGTASGVRMWTGAEWLASGDMLGEITSLLTFDRDGDGPLPRMLVAMGVIAISPFGPTHAVRFNGIGWSSMGTQIAGPVDAAVAVPDSAAAGSPQTLYAFAPFAGAPEPDETYLLRWNPPAWELAFPFPVGRTHCAIPYDAAGTMTIMRGTTEAIEIYNGAEFVELPGGSSTGQPVRTLAIAPSGVLGSSTDSIFAGGDFFRIGDVSSRYLAWHRGPEALVFEQPRARNFVAEGRTAQFKIAADGVESLHYLWRRNGDVLIDDGRIVGATTAVLTIDPVQLGDEGDYESAVSNDCGDATSDTAHLVVTGSGCPADINGDRAVTLQDLAYLLARFGDSLNVYGNEDINADGQVDLADLSLLLASFGAVCP